jgi:[ribosomal protein S5]-alanine N-acetyltransferase
LPALNVVPQMIIQTARLKLRPLAQSDFQTWLAAYQNVLPLQNQFDVSFRQKSELNQAFFSNIRQADQEQADQDFSYNFYAFGQNGGLLIGASQIWGIQRGDFQRGTLGFWVLNNYWNQGYGFEIAKHTLDFGFEKLGLNRIESEVLPSNYASQLLSEKLGMASEGIRRSAIKVNGAWQDHCVYSIISS